MNAIAGIVFSGDLLRTQPIDPYYADTSARLACSLFGDVIADATGIRPEMILARNKERFDRQHFYRLAGFGEVTAENWVRIVSGRYHPAADEYFAECFRDSLVIGHECGSLIRVMERIGLPFIDMRIAPIRFLEDLRYAFRTNLSSIRERLRHYMICEERIREGAQAVRAFYRARDGRADATPPGTLLLCGQTDLDLSLVRDGGVVRLRDHVGALRALSAHYRHILYKPHPMHVQAADDREVLRLVPGTVVTKNNFYRLLSDDNVTAVVALSSGTLHEAPYFDKRSIALSHRYPVLARSGSAGGPDAYVMTDDVYYGSAFWSDILSPAMPVGDGGEEAGRGRHNFLRNHFGMWWDYEIDKPKPSKESIMLRWCKRALRAADPKSCLRAKIDPTGKWRKKIKKML